MSLLTQFYPQTGGGGGVGGVPIVTVGSIVPHTTGPYAIYSEGLKVSGYFGTATGYYYNAGFLINDAPVGKEKGIDSIVTVGPINAGQGANYLKETTRATIVGNFVNQTTNGVTVELPLGELDLSRCSLMGSIGSSITFNIISTGYSINTVRLGHITITGSTYEKTILVCNMGNGEVTNIDVSAMETQPGRDTSQNIRFKFHSKNNPLTQETINNILIKFDEIVQGHLDQGGAPVQPIFGVPEIDLSGNTAGNGGTAGLSAEAAAARANLIANNCTVIL